MKNEVYIYWGSKLNIDRCLRFPINVDEIRFVQLEKTWKP